MRARRIPVSEVDKKKRGHCRLCGEYRFLTKTHIPARSAGNVGMARPPIVLTDEDGRETYGLGDEALGGIRDYWFCARCNNVTARWDEAFVALALQPLAALHDPQSRGNTFEATIVGGAVGEFVRCLWAWMFAISDNLRQRVPEVAKAVINGDAMEPPAAPRLFLGVTREVQIGIQALPNSIAVTAPPFVAVLLSERALKTAGAGGLFDTGPWLTHEVGSRPTVKLRAPVVDPGPLPMIGEPVVDS